MAATTWDELRHMPYVASTRSRMLTFAQAQDIRRLYAAGRYTYPALAEIYGVEPTTIGKIVRFERYRVEPPTGVARPPITDADWPLHGRLAFGQGRRCTYPFTACSCSTEPILSAA